MIQVEIFTFNAFSENTYVLYDETLEAIVIDPGCYDSREQHLLSSFLERKKLTLKAIYNTHCHIDHVLGNHFIKCAYKVDLHIHPKEEGQLLAVKTYAPNYGFNAYQPSTPEHWIEENSYIKFGNSALKVLFVPGHAPGHVAFWSEEDGFCVNGDVLFRESIGRTDLPGGNHAQLISSIRNVMFSLPDSTLVYAGHGPTTTIGHEKMYNPYVRL